MRLILRVIFAFVLICSPVIACEEGNCWINKYIAYQHDKMSNNDRWIHIEISRHAYRVMHEEQAKIINEDKKQAIELGYFYSHIKECSYREMIKIYPCKKSFLSYLFFNTKMG